MKIGITGADGFIGKRLCEALENRKHEIVKYDLSNLDISKEFELPNELDVIYHLAAINKPYLSKTAPLETFKVNALGTVNLLEAIRKAKIKKIIFPSSVFVYQDLTKTKETDTVAYNGLYPYGLEKIISEEYLKIYSDLFGIDYVSLRITGVYGPGMYKNPIYDIVDGFLKDEIKLYVNKDSIYNFVYIDDVVEALILALDWKNETLNIAADESVKVIDIYELSKKQFNKETNLKDTDSLIKIIGNNEKIKRKGWSPNYSLEKGLLETYNYLSKK